MNTEFDELLRDGMERFTSELRAPTDLAARARQSRRQRLTVRTAASGVAAMTVAGITFAALPATKAPVSVGIARHSVPERFDLEYLQSSRTDKTSVQAWTYHERFRVLRETSGRPTEGVGASVVKAKNAHHRAVATIVDYRRKEWARGRQNSFLTTATPSCHQHSLSIPERADALPRWVRGVHRLIKCGDLVISGTAQINGIQTIKLRASPSLLQPPVQAQTIWVKRSDYVPVRMVETVLLSKKHTETTHMDMSWLPPTRANLAMLRLRIPPGFLKVPFSKLNGTSSGSCHVSSAHPHKQACTHSG